MNKFLDFTTGPWDTVPGNNSVIVGDIGIEKDGNISYELVATLYGAYKNREGDSRLICAAPDMYLTLKKLKNDLGFVNLDISTIETVNWIIADIERGL